MSDNTNQIRNLAIIAHVDHGKTTLIDQMLKQSQTFAAHEVLDERVMDSNDLEKERGITILAKCTSIRYENNDGKEYKLNLIDTPGHADFGGEVERVLSLVEGVVLLVDSSEGPMPQTKFVLSKAIALGLRPIVVINKIDRPDRRVDEVLNEIFDLFVALDANDEQLDFPVLYASGRDGWATNEMEDEHKDLSPLFAKVIEHIQPPKMDASEQAPFKMLATILASDPYVGRILIGKVYSGIAKVGSNVKSINLDGKLIENTKLTKLFGFRGIERMPIDEAKAGDIVAIAGVSETSVSDTICSTDVNEPIPSTPIDPPTMSIGIRVNDSPLAGREGSKVTSRMIWDRLEREAETNVAITVQRQEDGDSFEVGGRGELQLGVLIETMRREGFELSVSKPMVLFKEEGGQKLEPIEEAVIDVDDEFSGIVVEKLSSRKGDMVEMKPAGVGKTRIIFHIPSRGLIGYQSEFRNDTRGTGVLNRIFHSYQPYKGPIGGRRNGALISNSNGETTAYSLNTLEERGVLFVEPRETVYEGMVIGEHNRENDLEVNAIKGNQLTNVRASGTDENIKLSPCKKFTLEEVISYIDNDELVEVTPTSIRIRKKLLCPHERKRASRQG
jgi:GTP-binding protein